MCFDVSIPIRLIWSTDGPLCLRSATASFWHVRCRRGPFSNRSSFAKTAVEVRPTRVTVLSAVSTSCRNIWSGPEARGIARSTTGLRVITCPRPRPCNCPHPRPGATRWSAKLRTSFHALRCYGLRCPAERLAGSPDTVQDYGQLARQRHPRLAWTGALLDGCGPVLQV